MIHEKDIKSCQVDNHIIKCWLEPLSSRFTEKGCDLCGAGGQNYQSSSALTNICFIY